jgi:hypothetical protein
VSGAAPLRVRQLAGRICWGAGAALHAQSSAATSVQAAQSRRVEQIVFAAAILA